MTTRAEQAAAIMRQTHALDISSYDADFVTRTLEKRENSTACASPQEYLQHLEASCTEADQLITSLLVHHSEFFRSPLSFSLLEQVVLPALAEQKSGSGKTLRIWSAGCAAGQEAYSIAILAEETAAKCGKPLVYQVTATDSSEACLQTARAGVYEESALGNVRQRYLKSYFDQNGVFFNIKPQVQARIDFSKYDLLDESSAFPPAAVFGGFDLVLCCNLLYYYNTAAQKKILSKLRRALVAGGFLVCDECEKEIIRQHGGFLAFSAYHAVFNKIA